MAATYVYGATEPQAIDPADVDLARRLVVALERRGLPIPDDQAVEIALELAGVDPFWP